MKFPYFIPSNLVDVEPVYYDRTRTITTCNRLLQTAKLFQYLVLYFKAKLFGLFKIEAAIGIRIGVSG